MPTSPIPDLLCFCHLRWHFVFQRPQHLMSRYEGRVFFIEEPIRHDGMDELDTKRVEKTNVLIVTPMLNNDDQLPEDVRMRVLLDELLTGHNINDYIAWYYSPMPLKFTERLHPTVTVYDCMDELSAFKFAPDDLKDLELRLFQQADVVFTGGNTLFEAKRQFHDNMYAFPSSIDKEHFMRARDEMAEPDDQVDIPHPRFGFYGVIDERFDIELVDELARLKPDWSIVLVGPVVKIAPHTLPRSTNIHYLGSKTYKELPGYLSGWDVAIMPFAINESTKFISPTKTPEYLCGGKPVISTAISDVVKDYSGEDLVRIANSASEFIMHGENLLKRKNREVWLQRVDERLSKHSWDITWEQMNAIINSLVWKRSRSTRERVSVQNF